LPEPVSSGDDTGGFLKCSRTLSADVTLRSWCQVVAPGWASSRLSTYTGLPEVRAAPDLRAARSGTDRDESAPAFLIARQVGLMAPESGSSSY
jgi:hypothetical protein